MSPVLAQKTPELVHDMPDFWSCLASRPCRMPRNHVNWKPSVKCHAERGTDRKVCGETVAVHVAGWYKKR